MTRLLKLATIIFTIISLTSAQIVDTLNTPIGPVTQGATVQVSWTLVAGVDATGKNGDLSAVDSATQNTIDINSAVPLAPKIFAWNVQVPPGTYTLGLNDGSGLKQSGQVVVKAAAGGTAPAPSGGAAAPAPAPSGGKAPAPAPAPAPPASSSPAGGVSPSAGVPTTSGGASAGGAAGAGGAGAAGGSTTPTGGASSSTSNPSSISTPSSASSIFSGYEIVFSLLGVAIAMVQF